MKYIFSEKGEQHKTEIKFCIDNFDSEGSLLGSGKRNSLRIFEIEGEKINIKSFKKPNLVNKIVYKYFRKSKAERSFFNAVKLLKSGIGTPEPIAYAEDKSGILFSNSYYVCKHLKYDLSYRELVTDPEYVDHENILRAFTRFTYELHENGIQFLDHSPGNTLIEKDNDEYRFYLVDLNRMNFKKLNFEERMMNFSRLTPKKEMVQIMASEYAKMINKPEDEVFEKMWFYTNQFQEKFKKKRELKEKLKFWKN